MKKVFIYNPDADAQSYYRGARPWQEIAKQTKEIQFDFVSKTSWKAFPAAWDQVGQYSLAFFQRPFHPDIVKAIANFKCQGVKIWVDWDDLVTEVPFSNLGGHIYHFLETQKAIKSILAMADVLTVSTDFLGQKFKGLTDAFMATIPNAWDLDLLPQLILPPKEKVCLWRGSLTHESDLYEKRREIYSVIEKNPDWQFYFMGCIPWWYAEDTGQFPKGNLPNMAYPLVPDESLSTWFECLKKVNPAVVFTVLRDTPFNRAKSNIAWMESSWVGAAVVGPNFDEWMKPGIVNFDADFEVRLQEALDLDTPDKQRLNELSWNNIVQNLTIAKANKRRMDILMELV